MKIPDSFQPEDTCYTVCGLVVLARPDHYQQVHTAMQGINGLDIYTSCDSGRFAITLEELPEGERVTEQIRQVQNLPGVIDVSLAYSHTEPVSDLLAADSSISPSHCHE